MRKHKPLKDLILDCFIIKPCDNNCLNCTWNKEVEKNYTICDAVCDIVVDIESREHNC